MTTRLSPGTQPPGVDTERHAVRHGMIAVGLLGIALIQVWDLVDELLAEGGLLIGFIIVSLILASPCLCRVGLCSPWGDGGASPADH